MAKRIRPNQGCKNCKYSFIQDETGDYFCGRKAGTHKKVSKKNWEQTDCPKWEYDGMSEGFDPKAEYDRMPNEC